MKKVTVTIGILFFSILLIAGSFSCGLISAGYLFPSLNLTTGEHASYQPTIKKTVPQQPEKPTASVETQKNETATAVPSTQDVNELFQPFWEAWDIVHNQYVDQPVDDVKMMRGAISGMLNSLGDQHTSYMDPDEFMQANIPLEGEYEGIGAWVDPNTEYLTIISPMKDSPAEKAGLKPGDEIIAVDGEDVTGVDGNLVIRKVLGPEGTKVTLTVRRKGVIKPFDVVITRKKITIPSVEYHMLDNKIGYIHLVTFGEKSKNELHTALEELFNEKPVGLVFDLRNNGGGYLTTAVDVASEFIDKGVVLYEKYGDGHKSSYQVKPGGIATKIPMVVLINAGTASASEIVAGAIQDHGRAPLVGVTSYGKGSVQNWIPLRNDQGAVRVTIARWLTPNERLIDKIGLEPDYKLGVFTQAMIDSGITPEEKGLKEGQYVILTKEELEKHKDPQLDKAIEVLLDETK